MSFFPRAFATADPNTSFTPLFRLLDDFDNYSRGSNPHHNRSTGQLKSFSPRFDVKELPDSYELHGEFPGVDQKDVEIEFTDTQTLTIHGRTERSYTSGTPPASLEGTKSAGAIAEGSPDSSHKATVEDEDAPAQSTDVTTTSKHDTDVAQPAQPTEKFWVSERSVGEFTRSFSFPTRVDQDAVKASMKNGILSIVVPKAKKPEARKIAISG